MIDKENIGYKQCKRCVMDTTDANISFDKNGYCNHCNDFFNRILDKTYQGASSDKALLLEIQRIKYSGRHNQYDCIVGISGGADSCYTASICKQLGLKVLLVHVDNGWDSEISVNNIQQICNELEMDYVSRVLNWEEFREIQLSHLKASVPEIESPTDIALLDELHKAAAEYNVKYIIMGGNYITEGILPKSWHYNAKDKKYSKAIHKQFSDVILKNFPSFEIKKELYYKFVKGIKLVYLLNYLPFRKELAIETLENIGWKKYGEKHHESFYTRIVQSYILPIKFNIDYRKATLSTKICIGEIDREEAIQILAELPYNKNTIESDIEYVCKKLRITKKDFDDLLNQSPKTYKDYPNDHVLLEFLYKVYQYFSGKS